MLDVKSSNNVGRDRSIERELLMGTRERQIE